MAQKPTKKAGLLKNLFNQFGVFLKGPYKTPDQIRNETKGPLIGGLRDNPGDMPMDKRAYLRYMKVPEDK